MLVLLFVFQNLLGEIWFLVASYYAIAGRAMGGVMFYGNYLERLVVVTVLLIIQYLVRRMQRDEKDSG